MLRDSGGGGGNLGPKSDNRKNIALHRAIGSAREGACCGRPCRRCTAQDFEALTWTFWPQQE